MRRRDFITLAGGAAAWPVVAGAQQAKMMAIGFLYGGDFSPVSSSMKSFREGLNEHGFVEGRNLAILFRGGSQVGQLPAFAAELAGLPVDVIIASGLLVAIQAAQSATANIPIVFGTGSDPVESRLTASLARPGGNLTGVTYYAQSLLPKRLQLLHELVPGADQIAVLINPESGSAQNNRRAFEEAARSLGLRAFVANASTENEVNLVFSNLAQQHVGALFVTSDAFFTGRREQITALAASHQIPASYGFRDYVTAGGLMSYGDDRDESYRQMGAYAGRILKGERPGDLPVLQPKKFDLVINLRVAKELGLTVPQTLLVAADEVIE